FGAGTTILFADLDVLAVGKVVNEVSADFDRYWASGSSYPVDLILPKVSSTALNEFERSAGRVAGSSAATTYMQAIQNSEFIASLLQGTLVLEWADTEMVSDDPAKGLGMAEFDAMLVSQL